MSVELVIRDPLGERPLAATDFPLGVGGPGQTIALAGLPAAPAAWIALHDGQLFLQPTEGGAPLRLNGNPVTRSNWLRDGDVIDAGSGRLRVQLRGDLRRIDVEDGSRGDLTVPPEPPAGETVSGGGDGEDERIEAVAFRRVDETTTTHPVSWRRYAGVAVAAALVFVLWFLWAGRSVEIVTHPQADTARLEGAFPELRTGTRHFVRPGQYTLVAQRAGFEVLRRPVTVTSASNQALEFTLEKLPGRLRIEVPVAAQVTLDGKPAGRAPGEFKLRAGKHVVGVAAPRHLPFQSEVDIAGEDRVQVLQAKLVPAWAVLEVLSEPSGAEVRIGDERRGVTPLKLELGAGSQRVTLRHAGYADWVSDVQIEANRPQTLGPVRLGLPDARLVVNSRPAGASLSVGGAYRGRTPVEIVVRPETPLPIVLARDGYESATSSVTLAPGEKRALDFALRAVLGEVTVQGTPSNAEVLAGGQVIGRLGQTFKLPSATQPIDVRATGYRTRRVEITPRPGLPQVIEVRLDPERGTSVATTATPAGTPVAAGAAEPARERGAASGRTAPPRLLRDPRGHQRRVSPVRCLAPLRLPRAEHARARQAAGRVGVVAAGGGVLQLAQPAGGPARGVRVEGRPPRAGAADEYRLPPADRSRVGMGRAREPRRLRAQVSVGRRAACSARHGQLRRPHGSAAAADRDRGVRRRQSRQRTGRELRAQRARVP